MTTTGAGARAPAGAPGHEERVPRSGRLDRLLRPAAAVVAGALLWLAFPPVALWPAALLGVAVLALAVRGAGLRRGAALGLLCGLAQLLPLLHWTGAVAGAAAWVALGLLEASFLALLGAGLAATSRLPGWPVWGAALWVLQEALRGRVPFGGFPWGRLGFSQVDSPLAGVVAVGGVPLLTFATVLLGGLLAALALRPPRRAVALGAVTAVALPALAVLVPTPTDGADRTVAVVQGNVPRLGLDAFSQRAAVLENHVAATRELAADVRAGRVQRPELVVWPENASDLDPFTDPSAYALIDEAVRDVGVPVLVGALLDGPGPDDVRNSGIVWDPVTGPGQTYVKQQLVPFGEYMPFRDQLRRVTDRVDLVPRDFVPGDRTGVLGLGPTVVGDVICYEVAYDGLVRDSVAEGGRLLVVQTNNATFGRSAQPEQQLAMSRLRALEHGRSTVIAATSGVSAVVGPDGELLQRSGIFTRDVLVADVPERSAQTLATRVGSWPELALVLVGAAGLVLALARARVRS